MAKITYENKEFLNKKENIADKNKVNDTDLNQIKEVVNNTFYADYSNNNIVSDANTATETGGYYTNANTLNLPINGSGGFLNVMYRSDDNITQTWTRYRDNQVFMRQKNTIEPSGWKEWSAIMTEPTVLYETDKTYSEVSTNTKITLTDDITKYKRVVLYGLQNERCFGSCEINDPQVNDKFSMFIASSGSRGGYYAFNSVVRLFTISNNKEITYGNATTLTSHTASQNNLQGFVLDTNSLKIYKIIGFKN